MSSKFATPFFQKSPLHGAYTSGADGMVTVSDAKHFAKLQSDAAGIVEKAYAPKENSCDNLDQKLANGTIRQGAYEILSAKCAKQNDENEDSDNTGSFENVTGDKPFGDINKSNKTKPFEGAGVSDYKESNKNNPFYIDNGYESPY
tara:strand:- start:11 stop:448 length:438 start_codon:yes stop_codon:yes gene_type:complete